MGMPFFQESPQALPRRWRFSKNPEYIEITVNYFVKAIAKIQHNIVK
jgi:hypothetical protein